MKLKNYFAFNNFRTIKKYPKYSGENLDSPRMRNITRYLPLRFSILLVFLVLIECVYEFIMGVYFEDKISRLAHCLINVGIVAAVITPPFWQLISLLKHHQDALQQEVNYQQLNGQLARAFGMVETESDIITVFKRVVSKVLPEISVELLLADSSMAHLRLAACTCAPESFESGRIASDPENGDAEVSDRANVILTPMCNVHSPRECMATRLSKNHIFNDSLALDACPVLIERCKGSIPAVCVPINIAGMSVGVIHSDITLDSANLDSIHSIFSDIARHLENRLGLVRALNTANQAAMTDALTGLLNRRSLEIRCEEFLASNRKFAVVVTDIDRFKKLNDTYSHAVGDRSLKVFATVLQKICRKDDLVARLGGEEFCVVLLDANAVTAVKTLERIRTELPQSLAQAGLPEFTASFGVTDTNFGDNLEALVKIADNAMYDAKKAGRDKIVVFSAKSQPQEELMQIANS